MQRTFDDVVADMRVLGEQLIPYNHPKGDRSLENYLTIVKSVEAVLDGYNLILHYSKADYRTHFLETAQVYGKRLPFLPFHLVAKIGKKFLGPNHLMLAEQLNEGQKIYCWNVVVDKKGKAIENAQYKEDCTLMEYEGFKYSYMQPGSVTSY
jgi:hypothetical protein